MPERLRLLHLLEAAIEAPGTDRRDLLELIQGAEPADVAFALQEFPAEDTVGIFNQIPHEHAAEILVEMTDEYARDFVAGMPIGRLQRIVDSLPPDDGADVYNLVPEAHRIGILGSIDKDLATQIRKLSEYEEQTAGAIMTTQFFAVSEAASAATVLEEVRQTESVETDQVYAVDEHQRLRGVMSLQDLLQVADPQRPMRELMEEQVISVHEGDDQEEVARASTTYGISTVPVVDDLQRLVGIVTADDIDHVQEEEASEDIFRMAGTVARHPTKLPVLKRIWNRLPTILATVLIGLLTAQILGVLAGNSHPDAAELATKKGLFVHAMRYVLIVIAVAGNVGTIANTIVVRGLATAELEHGRLVQPFWGELLVGMGVGAVCAVVSFVGIGLIDGSWAPLGVVVAGALFVAVAFSAAAGFVIPVVCARIGVDPALAGPLVIALNDLAGTSVYVSCLLFVPVLVDLG